MTPAQVDQVQRDFFGETFTHTNRFAIHDLFQQDERFPRITTSVPAQSAIEPIRPNFINQQPPVISPPLETIVIPPAEGSPAEQQEPQELQPPQSVPSEPIFVPPVATPDQQPPTTDWRTTDTSWDYKKFYQKRTGSEPTVAPTIKGVMEKPKTTTKTSIQERRSDESR